jgi:adenylate cyclase
VERAVACAIEMQNAMVHINSEQIGRDLPELQMGIGINTGEVVVGNIGSEQRAKYSAVGTPINTAYRIEAQTVGGQILVSPSTYEQVGSLLQVRGTLSLQFKGLHQPLTLYDVSGIQGAHPKVLKGGGPESLTPVDPPLAILCYQLEDKAVSGEAIPGSIQCLGGFVAEIVLAQPVNMNADLKVMVAPEDATGLPPAYAKVMSVVPSPSGHYAIRSSIRFTFLPEEVKAFLKTWCVGTP